MGDDQLGFSEGSELGRYRLKRLIGRGGMGEVYEAEDTAHDRNVALKLLLPSLSRNADFRERLQREARIAGRLQEPHVVPIHSCGEINGQWYVDMRLIDGTDLHTMLSRYGPLTPARAVAIVRQVAAALDAAHAAGVIHRDIKPENILITGDDFAYLVDFGLANAATDLRLTEMGTAVGTWAYMAPERFDDDEATYRADIYALACVLYEALTGTRPYPAATVSVMINSHLSRPVPRPSELRPDVPAALDEVIARGMAKEPEDRYATAGDFAWAAESALKATDNATSAVTAGEAKTQQVGAGRQPPPAPGVSHQATTPFAASTPTVATRDAHSYRSSPPASAWSPSPAPVQSGSRLPTPPAPSGPQQFGPPAPSGPQQFGPPAPSGPQHFAPAVPSGPLPPPGPGQPWPPQPPGKRNQWIWLSIAALIVVAILVGALVWFVRSRNHPIPVATPTSSPTTTAATSSANPTSSSASDPESKLMAELPRGYSSAACSKPTEPLTNSLATLDCEQNSEPGGPKSGVYALYGNPSDLQTGFNNAVHMNNQQLVVCPGGSNSAPTTWNRKSNPDLALGSVACGHWRDQYTVIWTVDSTLVLGIAAGDNLNDTYHWWQEYG
ncbi:MAG: protein kinase [Mycobacteriaceae bacterium]|nr:protein kinase [Mycobacteriaceae bacterium]